MFVKTLAYADNSDSSGSNFTIILAGAGIFAAMFLLAAILILVSRRRGHRFAEFILVAGIFWAIISAGCLIAYTNARLNWSAEYQLRMESGYGDPQDTSGAPASPVILWSGLGLAYGGLLGWGILGKGKKID